MADDESRIRAVIESWARAVHQGDMDGVLVDHADDRGRPLSRRRDVCIIDGSDDPDVDGWRKRQPRADEFQPSVLTHEVGGCDHPGTERNQR